MGNLIKITTVKYMGVTMNKNYLELEQEKLVVEYKLKNAEKLLSKFADIFLDERGYNKEYCEIMEYFDGSYED